MLPLALIAEGEEVRLIAIHGGHHMRKRLADLGLNTGTALKVIRHNPSGPMILAVKGSRLALGRGMANRVFVELIRDNVGGRV
jgi:Fe2+ transport system protein FeoA